ncbi:flagellar biosynthesis protein FlgC [Desulfocapsa sp. AH-315-G09]|uniref:Flagellar biosynthesis protein FlgC n=1 Tax=Desulfotalea psychrophila TaxID=84980 RepID=A0ABS3AUT1_9BACT|nr:flagellar biosynthesis protein FlgC [Desulfocapsa sp.]MBN4058670.1 flagellar biosynthesis protein FlgC [Desulfocapsa sp. AH-315-J15]MBN4065600.1 flagellar biosynthesis protein FlgC [Desulfocapsa sp. AH-315-G09]MBN4068870.1 flagellar biosynthesis protein FlgC [Desulfotalea psychrophila]
MIPAINSASSGLQAFGTKIHSNANNIANVSSEGYKKSRVTLSSQAPQGVSASVETIDSPGSMSLDNTNDGNNTLVELSNVDLAEELPDSQANASFYQANLKTLQTADEMTATLLNIKA